MSLWRILQWYFSAMWSVVKSTWWLNWPIPLCSFFCVGFILSLIMSDKLCAHLLSTYPFTCTLWLSNKLYLKLASPILLSFGSSLSAYQKLLYTLIFLLFPHSLGFILVLKIMSFPEPEQVLLFYNSIYWKHLSGFTTCLTQVIMSCKFPS